MACSGYFWKRRKQREMSWQRKAQQSPAATATTAKARLCLSRGSPVAPGIDASLPFYCFRCDCGQLHKSNSCGLKGRKLTYLSSPKLQCFCRKMSSHLTPFKLCHHIAHHSPQTTSKAGMTKTFSSHLLGNGFHPPSDSLQSLVSPPNPPPGPWPTCRMKSWTMLCSDT